MEIHPLLETGIVPNNSIWYVLAAAGDSPMMRVGHACVTVGYTAETNGQLYVIGGANPSGTFSDVYVLDLDAFTWIKRDGTGFAGRYEHSAFVGSDEPTRIYIFGGADGDGNRNDVQAYNTVENSWCAVKTSGNPPQPRTFHNGVCVGNRFIVYGGGDRGSEPVLDKKVYAFDTKKHQWSVLEVHGDAPKPRHGHVMAAVDSRVFIHGGMSGSNFFDDLHVLDLSRNSWFNVKVKSTKPPARAAHGSFVSGSDLYIFGGMHQNGALDDMFKLDTNLMQWTKVKLEGPPPANRLDFACCTLKLQIRNVLNNLSNQLVPHVEDESSTSVVNGGDCGLKIVSSDVQPSDARKAAANIIDLNFEDRMRGHTGTSRDEVAEIVETDADVSPAMGYSDLVQPMSTCRIENRSGEQRTSIGDGLSAATGTCECVKNDGADRTVELALVLGGMDTCGEIFDDCMLMRLSADGS